MIKEFPYKGHNLRLIDTDADSSSPREFDPYGTIITLHRTYDFSDGHAPKITTREVTGWEDLKKRLKDEEKAVAILPIYMYDHSSQSLSTEPFNDYFDSAQIGFIYATEDDILTGSGRKVLTDELIKDAEGYLKSEIELMHNWHNDNCFGFVVDPVNEEDEEGAFEEYGGGWYTLEEAEREGKAGIDRLAAVDEELALIKNLKPEELPKYVNHDWKFPQFSEDAFKDRLRESA